MRRFLMMTAMALAIGTGAATAGAAPCKDAKGKFIKCPPQPKKPVRCKNARGHFAKCGTPGAKPA